MLDKTHKIRRTGILVALGAAIAAFAVPAALGAVGSGFDGSVADFMVGASPRSAEGAGWGALAT